MKKIVILGAGTAGTMMANHLQHELNHKEWALTIIDEKRSIITSQVTSSSHSICMSPAILLKPSMNLFPKE